MTLRYAQRFRVKASSVRETVKAIQSAGRDGYELFVLWSGRVDINIFTVDTVHIPEQTSYKLESGLCVRVDGEELHKLNVWLYRSQQIIGVQVHSHPADAYHSLTDDAYPIATLEGSLSVVLPYFGWDGWESVGVATYRLESGRWREVTSPIDNLIEVIADGTG